MKTNGMLQLAPAEFGKPLTLEQHGIQLQMIKASILLVVSQLTQITHQKYGLELVKMLEEGMLELVMVFM